MDWKQHVCRVGSHRIAEDDLPTDSDALAAFIKAQRRHIEPWLSAVFQAEHLNLLLGSGFTAAIGSIAGSSATGMGTVTLGTTYDTAINRHATAAATAMKRGTANIEDQLRSALAVLEGLKVTDPSAATSLKTAIDGQLTALFWRRFWQPRVGSR